MKVYVDSDNYEIYYNSLNGRECLESLYAPLIVENIHDYTKQVRKEVCEEIKDFVSDQLIARGDLGYYDIERILDQIQEDRQ